MPQLKQTLTSATLATTLAIALAACGQQAAPAKSPASTAVVLPPTSKVLSPEGRRALVAVSPDGTLRFAPTTPKLKASSSVHSLMIPIDNPDDIEVGQTLSSPPIPLAPDGFLVKVTDVQRGPAGTVVSTEGATVEEAVQDGEAYLGDPVAGQPLTTADVEGVQALAQGVQVGPSVTAQGLHSQAQTTLASFHIDLNNVQLGSGSNTLVVNGAIDFRADAIAHVHVSWFSLKHFDASVRLDAREHLDIQGNAGSAWSAQVPLARYHFRPFTIWMGFIPLVFRPELTIMIGADGKVSGTLNFVADRADSVQAGVQYDGGWSPIWNHISNSNVRLALQGSFQNRTYLEADAGMYLYGLAGPYAYIRPFIDFAAQANVSMNWPDTGNSGDPTAWYQVRGGFAAGVGIDASKIKRSWKWAVNVTEVSDELAHGGTQPAAPTPPSPPTPTPPPDQCPGPDALTPVIATVGATPQKLPCMQ